SFLIYSKKYLEVVPEGDLFINFGSDKDGHHLVWDVFVSDEYTEESGVLLQEALHLWGKSVNRPFQAHLSMDYAILLYEKNNVEEAHQYAKKVLSIGEDYKITSLIVGSKLLMAKIAFA